jgi:hypothetical protein
VSSAFKDESRTSKSARYGYFFQSWSNFAPVSRVAATSSAGGSSRRTVRLAGESGQGFGSLFHDAGILATSQGGRVCTEKPIRAC